MYDMLASKMFTQPWKAAHVLRMRGAIANDMIIMIWTQLNAP